MNCWGSRFFLLVLICFGTGCANITAPTGGKKDITPPKLLLVSPADSLLNTRPRRIEMTFDEYITVSDAGKEVEISPLLSIQPVVTGLGKRVVAKIVDSLLEDNTTYRLSFGRAIKDLHEGNVFSRYVYTFSTGSYFDSLQVNGSVINAATGMADTSSIFVELYSAKESDSAVVRHKPKYITKTDAKGNFSFKGLPARRFRIYALRDGNGNLIYDGPAGGEMIAFNDKIVLPGDTARSPILLRMFQEPADTSLKKGVDSAGPGRGAAKTRMGVAPVYLVSIDTANSAKRLFDINYPINILFRTAPVLNKEKITLTYDSSGVTVSPPITIKFDSVNLRLLHISTRWAENMVYTLRLVKGFAKDTSGKDIMPSRYTFRTKEDDDYGAIHVHLPARFYDEQYLLMVLNDNKDTVYLQPITDTVVNLIRLNPAKYTFRIIVDANGNGKWDTGDLFGKKQPEEVIPYNDQVILKANWSEEVDDWDRKIIKK